MAIRVSQAFNGGEWSPLVRERYDLERYSSACERMHNCQVLRFGPVRSRPGLLYDGPNADSSKRGRLIGFNFSTTTSFEIELGDNVMRFWNRGELVQSGGSPLEVVTPWEEADLPTLQWQQLNDITIFSHPLHEQQVLTRLADDDWTLEPMAVDYPAFQDRNTDEGIKIQPSATSGSITLTATGGDVFRDGDVGNHYELSHRRASDNTEADITANRVSAALRVVGEWSLFTYGIWEAKVRVERSSDPAALDADWETVLTRDGDKDRNIVFTGGQEDEETYLRIRILEYRSHATATDAATPRALLEASEGEVQGYAKITAVTSPTVATATVVKSFELATATDQWARGAWNNEDGWPSSVAFHDQRLVFGGTANQPSTVWASVVGDFYDFRLATLDDSALAFTLAATQSNRIRWIVSHQSLAIGTAGDEWIVEGGGDGSPLTPTNVRARRQSKYGSCLYPATLVDDVVMFLQRDCRTLRDFSNSFERNGWISADLSQLSEHLLRSGVYEVAVQNTPDTIVWMVCGDGSLVGLTYQRDEGVVAFHSHSTKGLFESVCVTYGEDGESDEVSFLVRREINGQVVRSKERFDPDFRNAVDEERQADFVCSDSAVIKQALTSEVTGLDHLEGETVSVLRDGAVDTAPGNSPHVVQGGSITLSKPGENVVIGLPFNWELEPHDFDFALEDGNAQGRKFRLVEVEVRLHKSLGVEAAAVRDDGSVRDDDWRRIHFRGTDVNMGSPEPPFTGTKSVFTAGPHVDRPRVRIRGSLPLPATLTALIHKFDVYGD